MLAFKWLHSSRRSLPAFCTTCLLAFSLQAGAAEPVRKTFATPEEAASSLVAAAKANDDKELLAILGPSLKEWIEFGDPVADRQAREKFVSDCEQKQSIDRSEPRKATIVLGDDDFPFPIPLVKSDGKWSFDPEQGKQEIIDRRVGETSSIRLKLCWRLPTHRTTMPSSIRSARARASPRAGSSALPTSTMVFIGQRPSQNCQVRSGRLSLRRPQPDISRRARAGESSKNPYHGYYFRVLTGQGSHAPGGAYSYLVNGRMMGGFAVIAWPAKYGVSGYKTFMINQDQTVYQSDLGPDTADEVQEIETFDPDEDWTKVEVK